MATIFTFLDHFHVVLLILILLMTSSADVADLKENVFGRTICPLRFAVTALMFSGLRPERRPKKKKKNPGLNRVKHSEPVKYA